MMLVIEIIANEMTAAIPIFPSYKINLMCKTFINQT